MGKVLKLIAALIGLAILAFAAGIVLIFAFHPFSMSMPMMWGYGMMGHHTGYMFPSFGIFGILITLGLIAAAFFAGRATSRPSTSTPVTPAAGAAPQGTNAPNVVDVNASDGTGDPEI